LAYFEVDELVMKGPTKIQTNTETQMVSLRVSKPAGDEWIAFHTPATLSAKENFADGQFMRGWML
jgi:hypothetical protein